MFHPIETVPNAPSPRIVLKESVAKFSSSNENWVANEIDPKKPFHIILLLLVVVQYYIKPLTCACVHVQLAQHSVLDAWSMSLVLWLLFRC